MQSVNIDAVKKLEQHFDEVLKDFPNERKKLHEGVGAAIKRELDVNIAETVNDIHFAVRRWQIVSIGSGGGYAAIRPMGTKEGGISGSNGQGAITNYLNTGHAIRKPRIVSANYRSRAKLSFVTGRRFYQNTEGDAQRIALRETQKWAETTAGKLKQNL